MTKIFAEVKRGKAVGTELTPHVHKDGCFVVSKTRFEKDYVRVSDEAELINWVNDGYSVRMSNPEMPSTKSPSLISPSSIQTR